MDYIGIKILAAVSLPLLCVSNIILSFAVVLVWACIGLLLLLDGMARHNLF